MTRSLAATALTATLLCGLTLPALADSIQRIVHPDGTVEFTNRRQPDAPLASSADATVYRYRDENGVVSYSGLQPRTATFDVIRFQCYACDPDSPIDWHKTPLFVTPYKDEVRAAARTYQVDPALVRAVIHAESGFNPEAVSPRGAEGLMQLMPDTARELGVANALEAAENIRGGVRYLAQMLKRFDGDVRLATAAYNAGPGAVTRYKGVPPYAETQAYVKRVGILRDRYAAK
ncbi:transglycosylase SLT domain-containing protein [Marinobacter sp. C2H3]|uniref:transglycosylase SLT domain-containing protein n=1 Tax=Marinobacter sp. C2H3 TaxID=3119003 RepID=UPI00300E6EB0